MGFHSPTAFATATRVARGARNHAAGRMAEDNVAAWYARQGGRILAQRWRCQWGEIDLIVAIDDMVVFVEVKSARTHDQAAWRLGRRQMDRICAAATAYCAHLEEGMLTPMRFDAALVDGMGRVSVIENAFGDW